MGRCECFDKGCKAHLNLDHCNEDATVTLWRVDMTDETGTQFCDDCAEDAIESGLFSDEADEMEEGQS